MRTHTLAEERNSMPAPHLSLSAALARWLCTRPRSRKGKIQLKRSHSRILSQDKESHERKARSSMSEPAAHCESKVKPGQKHSRQEKLPARQGYPAYVRRTHSL